MEHTFDTFGAGVGLLWLVLLLWSVNYIKGRNKNGKDK